MGEHSSSSTGGTEGLRQLMVRLERHSLQPDFQRQRELALTLALQPYLDPLESPPLSPLPEEEHLAQWYLYADYLPTDGHASLIEHIRDLVSEHVPEEERIWLDPFRHSYMDLLEVQEISSGNSSVSASLQSLGDRQVFEALLPVTRVPYQAGHVLLTRLLRGRALTCPPGLPLMLSSQMGKIVFEFTNQMRQNIEVETGNFALSEWAEFSKSYGYLMIWSVARVRRGTWAVVDSQTTYFNSRGESFLYALALYEHHAFRALADGLNEFELFTPIQERNAKAESSVTGSESLSWIWLPPPEPDGSQRFPVARLTLTPTQLFVETDSPGRLDTIKHQLAAAFGFSLHFRGETTSPPQHTTPEVDLLSESYTAPPTVISQEEEQQILTAFLEKAYLDWAETASPFLNGQSPRHYCAARQDTKDVATIINQMECHDLGRRRTGQCAYNYNILRGHIGL